ELERALERDQRGRPPHDHSRHDQDQRDGKREDSIEQRAGLALDELETMQPLGKAEDAAVLVLLAENGARARLQVDHLAVEEAHLRGLSTRGANAHVVDLAT